jgi:phosphohistidine swiveling domain-containing protein
MLRFSTKAQTLAMLSGMGTSFSVLPQISFTVDDLRCRCADVEARIQAAFSDTMVIVRSSTLSEDTALESKAGHFLSVSRVACKDAISAALEVAASFEDDNLKHEIFVQPMLVDIAVSGVLFTVDPNTGGNYFIINYDTANSNDSVTSGNGKWLYTRYVFRGKPSRDPIIQRVLGMAVELINLFSKDELDIEFAIAGDVLFLLQVRPLVLKVEKADLVMQSKSLEIVHDFLCNEMTSKPHIKGDRTIYGIMPDWNPAEMIGVRPKPLALSLYRRLITDSIWAYQRDKYGYMNLRSFPLMADFLGLPYIDTRVSFNSFIPKDIDENLSLMLVDYYLNSLSRCPEKHDKVEFEIILSCYTFDLPNRVRNLKDHGFSEQHIETFENSLRHLTNNIINVKDGLWMEDVRKIKELEKRQHRVMDGNLTWVEKIYWLLEDCARYGTLPFAGLARAAFIAAQLLQSLVNIGILTEVDHQRYMSGLHTVCSQITADQRALSRERFLMKYGYLRPGTYDITSKRYDADPDLYFSSTNELECPDQQAIHTSSADGRVEEQAFALTLGQLTAIQNEMTRLGLTGDVLTLFSFLQAAIEGREYAKFVFSKSISDALELIAGWGEYYGFNRDDMSYIDISIIDRLHSSPTDAKEAISRAVALGRDQYTKTLTFSMPPVVQSADDIYDFLIPVESPNFITQKRVIGDVFSGKLSHEHIRGKILMIPAADPGYDWVFSHDILGLITAFGGANSHMAIRAGEMGIPAVIGAGEKLFNQWKMSRTLYIDCSNRIVEIIR